MIHDLRVSSGLTQRDLASLVGTSPSVISRLEDADYRGHSLSILRRIASALGRNVDVRFSAAKAAANPRPSSVRGPKVTGKQI